MGRGTDVAGRGDFQTPATGELFDHEKLVVYQVAREFLLLATEVIAQKVPREIRDQFDRASMSILFNIGEGAGKMARADKQRFYEIARGSALECATQLEVMNIRGIVTNTQYQQARTLLLRIAKMLSRLSSGPRTT